ncbi:MAG: hypothetical protein ABIU10_00325 [Sphingomicrobium sp.]
MRAALIGLAVATAGCDDRSNFDQRYDETANEIQNRSARIDAELNSSNSTTQGQSKSME